MKAGLLRDSGEHLRAEFFVVVKGKHEVWPLGVGQRSVRSRLALAVPTHTYQGREHATRLRRGPATHAARKDTSRSSAGASAWSSRSANTRGARAWTGGGAWSPP